MNTYEEIADAEGLDPLTKERFVKYMRTRWGDPEDESIKCRVGYAEEWAGRFKDKEEYGWSDLVGQAVLREIDKEV